MRGGPLRVRSDGADVHAKLQRRRVDGLLVGRRRVRLQRVQRGLLRGGRALHGPDVQWHVRSGLLLPRRLDERDSGHLRRGLLFCSGRIRVHTVRGGFLHGDGQHVSDGQPVQCGRLLRRRRNVARGHDVPCWFLLPRRLGRGDAVSVWLLHELDGRGDVHRVHGGLLHRDGQRVGDGDCLHAGQVLPPQLHECRRVPSLHCWLLLRSQCQRALTVRRGYVFCGVGVDVLGLRCWLLHGDGQYDGDVEPVQRGEDVRTGRYDADGH